MELARIGAIDAVACQEILDELAAKLRTKLSFTLQEVADTLADLLGFLRLVQITGTLRVVVDDADDDKVIECAVIAGASYVVTGDRQHLLPLGSYQGVQIVSPAELLARPSVP